MVIGRLKDIPTSEPLGSKAAAPYGTLRGGGMTPPWLGTSEGYSYFGAY